VVGSNVTETWQLELASTEMPQVFATMANGPVTVVEVMLSATRLELESVTVSGEEIVSTWTLPNDKEAGDTVGVTMMPIPDNVIVCVGVTELSVTTIVPLLLPV
jgi:hypothetical protein